VGNPSFSQGSVARLELLAWWLLLFLFACFAVYVLYGLILQFEEGLWFQSDFFAEWCFAKFAWEGNAAHMYDNAAMHAFQLEVAQGPRPQFPYAYPPSFLLYIYPLAALPGPVAYALWMGVTFALYLAAAWPRRGDWLAYGLVLLAPALAANLGYGQNGFLTAALLLGGFRLLPSRPLLAGVAFGLLSYKPQFGVFIPIALVAARQWRCMAAATVTAIALVALSSVAFGWALWPEWLTVLPRHGQHVDFAVDSYFKPTLRGALLLAEAAPELVKAVPLLVMAVTALLVWWCFRVRSPLAVAVLVAGTFAAAPYAFLYDLPAITGAAIAALAARPPGPVRLVDDAVIAFSLSIAAIMTLTSRFYWTGGLGLLLLFALVAWRAAPWRFSSRIGNSSQCWN